MKRRTRFAISALMLVAACGSSPAEQQTFDQVTQSIKAFGQRGDQSVSAEEIRARLTPEVRAQFGNRPLMIAQLEQEGVASVLVQASKNLDVETYLTPDGISVSLQRGVLVGTRGLGFDLMSADVSEVHSGLQKGTRGVRIHRYLDGEDQIVIKSFICDYSGNVTIVESCYGEDHSFENRYRMSAGRITASRQWIGPARGYILLEPS